MVEEKPEEAFSFLKDNSFILLSFLFIFITSCADPFENFDKDIENQTKILEDFNKLSDLKRKEFTINLNNEKN